MATYYADYYDPEGTSFKNWLQTKFLELVQ